MLKKLLSVHVCFLFINYGFSQFSEANNFSWQGGNINQLHIGDMENDGDLDIVASNIQTGPRFIENDGSNSFEYPVYMGPEEIDNTENEMADFDNDGDLDLISIRPDAGTVTLFTNDGENTFTKSIIYLTDGDILKLLESSDINADGLPDLTLRITFSTLINLKNNGDGTFTTETIVDDALNVVKYHQFDADGDGDLDISYFENTGNLFYAENLGVTYATPVLLTGDALSITAIKSIDFNEDGDIDLIYSKPTGAEVVMVENLGDGTFAEPLIIASFVAAVIEQPVDLDNDGKLDILVNDYIGGTHLNWMRNLGGGDFADLAPITSLFGAGSGEFIDFDADGDADLIEIMHTGTIGYYENLGGVEFTSLQYLSETTLQPYFSLAMDADNDGDKDLFCCSTVDHKIAWVENLGEGHFGDLKTAVSGLFFDPLHMSSADIDGDDFNDLIAVSDYESTVVWFKNMGDGTFSDAILISEDQVQPNFVLAADWDNDGDNDVIASSSGDHQIMLYENIEGSLAPIGDLIFEDAWLWLKDMRTLDLDNDGDLDILFGSGYDSSIDWLENTGDLEFTHHTIADLTGIQQLHAADMNEDGKLDILVASPLTDEVHWIENLGAGLFGELTTLISGSEYPLIALFEDMNNDGVKDLLVGSKDDNTIGYYEHYGDLEFGDLNVITDNLDWVKNMLTGDLDQDGDHDIVSISVTDGQFNWFENMHFTSHSTKGTVFIDLNENGIQDAEDEGVNFAQALSTPESYYAFTSDDGEYLIAFDETEFGDYTIYPQALDFWNISTATSYDVTIEGGFTFYENLDFGIYPSELVDRVEPIITGGIPRIDRLVTYWLDFSNTGSTIASGNLHLELDEALTYAGANLAPNSVDGQNIYWSYEELDYFEDAVIEVTVLFPNYESLGEDVRSYFTVEVESLGEVTSLLMDSLDQVIQGAYDPNDKNARPAGTTEYGYIAPDTETIEYLVRFQNTGTDTAFVVVIDDQLDANLDWTSLTPLAWSHDMEIEVDHDGLVSFIFDNIMLPDSNVSEIASHGFVKYKIDLLPGLPLETSIYNTAHIYFDANPAVITNTTVNTLHLPEDSGISENGENHITVYPNPFSEILTIQFGKELVYKHTVVIYDILGTEVYRQANITSQQIQIKKADMGRGLYVITVLNANAEKVYTTKIIAE